MKLNADDKHCQPCADFKPAEICPHTGNPQPHECYLCKDENALRYFCNNCHKDHHSDGWNSCAVNDLMRGCTHPACKKRVEGDRESD